MHSIVLSSLLPVVILIAIGFIACRAGWMRAEATKDLGHLVFMVLTPALLFRTMRTVHVERLDFKPVVAYFVAVMGLHGLTLTVLVVTASLPIGANVFMFSQRYQVAEELVTASVAVSTALAERL